MLSVAPARAAAPPDAQALYAAALQATAAVPQPPLIVFHEDITARSLHPVCSQHQDRGVFAVDGGGGRNGSTYQLTFYAGERTGTAENVRTHERCTGSGLWSPVPAVGAASHDTQDRGDVSVPDVVGETLRDERATYRVAFDGEEIVDGAKAWRLVLTPRESAPDDGDAAASKTLLVDEADFVARFAQVDRYWLVTNWALHVNARAIVVPLHFAFDAHAYDFTFGERRQATATRAAP